MPTSQILIDEQVREIVSTVYSGASSREIAIAIEAEQAYIDYLDWLKDNISVDTTITIEVDGARIKFKDDEDFSEWLAEQMAK